MTFQAEEALLVPDQHRWIHRPMGLVATHAPLQTHGGMLKGEGASFVCVALDAGRFVAKGDLDLPGLQPAMRLMTIDAADRSFVQSMPKGLQKGSLNLLVTIGAE